MMAIPALLKTFTLLEKGEKGTKPESTNSSVTVNRIQIQPTRYSFDD